MSATHNRALSDPGLCGFCQSPKPEARKPPYPNFAVIEILEFNTFDTGHPFSAASAYF
jgi:hypothetical protein